MERIKPTSAQMKTYQKGFNSLITLFFLTIISPLFSQDKQEINGNIYPYSVLKEVPFHQITLDSTDKFWYSKLLLVQKKTLPFLFSIAESQGKIDNFKVIGGKTKGKITLNNASDSDIYKLIEAASYTLQHHYDKSLDLYLDTLIEYISSAQLPDGYLNTQYTLPDSHEFSPDLNVLHARRFGYGIKDRWKSTLVKWPYAYSQLYCLGHLLEAAVTHFRATGKTNFLSVGVKAANHLLVQFDKDKIEAYADHPQVEIGLLKLYEVTQDKQYLDLADLFTRYVKFGRPKDIRLSENSKPLHDQREAFSHCVRTGYIYTSGTDVVRAKGSKDLEIALQSIWQNVVSKKMYIHGGVGNGTPFEQHGFDFDLPILNTYSESCANIAQGQWNHSLNLLYGNGKYADIVEWEMYNGALSGFGEDGITFLYANKLNLDTSHRIDYHSGVRQSFLFCCPAKLPGFIAGISRWIYAFNEEAFVVNQYVSSSTSFDINEEPVKVRQISKMPWIPETILVFEKIPTSIKFLKFRLPSWSGYQTKPIPEGPYYYENIPFVKPLVTLNNKTLNYTFEDGYIVIQNQNLGSLDSLKINFDMPVRRIYSDTTIVANRGRIALSRGPLLYSLEGVDHNFDILKLVLPANQGITPSFNGNQVVLNGNGKIGSLLVKFKAIPYYSWQNRGIHDLCTLIIEDETLILNEKKSILKMNTDG